MTIEIAVTLAAIVGLLFGAIVGMAWGIKDEAKKSRTKWETLINSAMANAYQAGWIDAKSEDKKRPSGNKDK